MTKTNIVIGAGLTGAVIANLLATLKNEKVLVVDRRTNVGGNCYDYRDKSGVMVQRHGSQVFHTSDERVWNYLKHFTDFNQYMHENVVIVDGFKVSASMIPFSFSTFIKARASSHNALVLSVAPTRNESSPSYGV